MYSAPMVDPARDNIITGADMAPGTALRTWQGS